MPIPLPAYISSDCPSRQWALDRVNRRRSKSSSPKSPPKTPPSSREGILLDNFGYVYYDDYVKVLTNEETYPVTKRGHLHPPTDMWRMAANYAVNIFSIKFVFHKFRFLLRRTSKAILKNSRLSLQRSRGYSIDNLINKWVENKATLKTGRRPKRNWIVVDCFCTRQKERVGGSGGKQRAK